MENTNDTPPAYDAGEERHVARRSRSAKAIRLQHDDDFRWLMGDARGRRFIWEWLAKAGVFRSSMGLSTELTAFNEGRRDLGLAVLADLMRLCPDDYGRMQAEAISKQPATNGETDGGRDDSAS